MDSVLEVTLHAVIVRPGVANVTQLPITVVPAVYLTMDSQTIPVLPAPITRVVWEEHCPVLIVLDALYVTPLPMPLLATVVWSDTGS